MPQHYQPTTANEAALIQQNNALFQENYKRSQNEQALYNEWQKVTAEKQQLSDMVGQMQLHTMELENKLTGQLCRLPQLGLQMGSGPEVTNKKLSDLLNTWNIYSTQM